MNEQMQISKQLAESENILKYCFQVTIPQVAYRGESNFATIEKIADQAMEQCCLFLEDGCPTFFGVTPHSTDYLFSHENFMELGKALLRDDAVVSFYVFLRDILTERSATDASTALRLTYYNPEAKEHQVCGMEYLIDKGSLTIEEDFQLHANKNYPISDKLQKYLTSKNTAFKRQLENIDRNISKVYPSHRPSTAFCPQNCEKQKGGKIRLGNLEYGGALCSVSKRLGIMEKICTQDPFYASDCKKYYGVCEDILGALDSKYLKRSDYLYAKYQMEATFHMGLCNCLYQEIESINQKNGRPLFENASIEKLAQCAKLPNVFSRNLFVSAAFYTLYDVLDSKKGAEPEFFSAIRSKLLGGFVTKAQKSGAYYDPVNDWLTRYNRMIDYFSDFIFPLYQSIFMVSLFRSMRQYLMQKEPQKNSGNKNYDGKILFNLTKYLRNYLDSKPIYDDVGSTSKEKTTFAVLRQTPVNFAPDSIPKTMESIQIYRRCVAYSRVEAQVNAPITFQDLDVLLPDKQELREHMILQIGKVPEQVY